MTKSLTVILALLLFFGPLHAQSDAEADASAVFDTFLVAMTNADTDTITSLFAEDALFWGTGSQSLVTTPAGVQAYFGPVGRNEPGATLARALDYETRMVAGDLVMVSGMWEIVPGGQTEGIPMRVSMLLENRSGQWRIIQFHNSRVPE